MLFAPRNCPHCGIKWTDRAHSGICDLCGYSLAEGKQTAQPFGPSRRQIQAQRTAAIPRVDIGSRTRVDPGARPRVDAGPRSRVDPGARSRVEVPSVAKVRDDLARGGFRPLVPGILVRDPDDLLSSVDPSVMTALANRMTRVLGRQGEGMVQGALPAKRVPLVQGVLQAIYLAVPGRRAELLVVSEPRELPVRVHAVPAGANVADLPGRPVSRTLGESSSGRLAKLLRLIVFLAAIAYFFLMKYLQHHK